MRNQSNKYANGYAPKIAYWTEVFKAEANKFASNSTEERSYDKVIEAMEKIKYFEAKEEQRVASIKANITEEDKEWIAVLGDVLKVAKFIE
jgi:hypothetical protein